MNIVKSTERMPVGNLIILIYGQPGIGKTSLAFSASRPLLLDFDKGAARSGYRGDTLVIESWDSILELEQNKGILNDYDTIIVDTVGRALDVLFAKLVEQTPKLKTSVGPSRDGWGAIKVGWERFLGTLRTFGKDVILIAHDKEDKEKEPPRVRPAIIGGSYDMVIQNSEFVGYYKMGDKDRILNFNPHELWIGKNSCQFPEIHVPNLSQDPQFMAGLVSKMREGIGAVSENSKQLADTVQTWRDTIEGFTTADEFNAMFPEFMKLQPPIKNQVSQIIKKRRIDLGIEYDPVQGFIAPAKKQDPDPVSL